MTGVRRDEEGAVLLMALVFLTVAAVMVAALLSFADADFRTTVAVRDQRNVVYAADGAVESAVNYYRFNGTCPSSLPSLNGVTGVAVTCAADSSGGSSVPTNAPPLAVITRAEQAIGEDGITVVSGALTRVRGGAFSSNTIDVSAGSNLEVAGSVTARWGCNRPELITTTTGMDCDIGNDAYPTGDDPDYAAAAATAPALATVPACPPSGPVVFSPGTYNDRAALVDLFDTCGGRVFHFPPAGGGVVGVYYFDFQDTGGGTSHEWTIANPSTVVVGGALPAGVTLDTVASQPMGSRCDEDAPGVQFLFGNDSRMNAESSEVELCAQHDPTETAQEIAVYGVKTTEAGAGPGQAAVTPLTATSAGFAPAADGRAIDGATADAAVASTDPTADTITLTGFDVSGIPVGSAISQVTLAVEHRDHKVSADGSLAANLTLSGTVASPTGGSAALGDKTPTCGSACLTKSETLHEDELDITSTFATLGELAGLTVTYQAAAKKAGSKATSFTEQLDGVELRVTYTSSAPRLRAQTGCVTVAPYGVAGSCALVRTGGSQADLAVHGTVYAPLSALDIHLVLVSYQVFKRGVVVRHLRSNVTPSSPCADATPPIPDNCYPFQLPGFTPGPSDVVFVARVDGRTRLRALVRFSTGATPPQVLSWSVVNEP